MKTETLRRFNLWKKETEKDNITQHELNKMSENISLIEMCFGTDIQFGTGGIRAIMGVGSSRMNDYNIARISQGVANFLNKDLKSKKRVVVGYDSRINSRKFAEITADVFAANDIEVYFWKEIVPTPVLAYSIKYIEAELGIMITASHNSYEYNGYKIYEKTSLQILPDVAKQIAEEFKKVHLFKNVRRKTFAEGVAKGKIKNVPDNIPETYLRCVNDCSVLSENMVYENEIEIVYTPLCGTGKRYVEQILKNRGFRNLEFVEEQKMPNGDFPTCRYPNPEEIDAFRLGIEYAEEKKADIVLATDPDCDRVGVVVKDGKQYTHLTGNQIGVLLLDFICSQKRKQRIDIRNGVLIKSFVTTDMAEAIARDYELRIINVPTGFKYIGSKINELEERGEIQAFVMGMEESCGYLSGTYIRDKDGVLGSLLICEMCAYYKSRGKTLVDRLNELYNKYGYYVNTMYKHEVSGHVMQENIMRRIRDNPPCYLGNIKIKEKIDFEENKEVSYNNSIKWVLEQDATVYIRPSGTEPKIKIYISTRACSKEDAEKKERIIKQQMFQLLQG